MKYALLCVGKLREAYFRDAAQEYSKRLGRYGALECIEVPDLSEPKNASPADIRKLVDAEGQALLAQLKPRDHVIALAIDGKQMDSPSFARRIQALEDGGAGRIVLIIGGSNGLSQAVLSRADEKLSFSAMTFPHQLARVMLLEQLYRAHKILARETYHK